MSIETITENGIQYLQSNPLNQITVNGVDYFLQRWPNGTWQDYLYLWSDSVGDNETFTVHMGEPHKQDFTPNLRYEN